ncbi:hypothetical protein [Bacteroides sp. 224]|uniref:hypothetical protein n=1 Tax=Bacteroides sp. 224 TaxID=2302936 RepID=UPI001EF37CCF|nr:hypothetical protein [Bacteroides sp. 224]
MGEQTKNIYVYADWIGLNYPHFMGTLTVNQIRGKEIFSFQYDDEWLRDDKLNFGMFLDSSPDRWGRVLMKRREIASAKQETRKSRTLFESDFLLGVYDPLRMGGLRFKTDKEGAFLDNSTNILLPHGPP